MSKGDVHLGFYLFDEPGVEEAVREIEALIQDVVQTPLSVGAAVEKFHEEWPVIQEKYEEFGAGDSEPETEVCERIMNGLSRRFCLTNQECEILYDELRWEG